MLLTGVRTNSPVSSSIHMLSIKIHQSAAPCLAMELSSINPLSTSIVADSLECEGKDTLATKSSTSWCLTSWTSRIGVDCSCGRSCSCGCCGSGGCRCSGCSRGTRWACCSRCCSSCSSSCCCSCGGCGCSSVWFSTRASIWTHSNLSINMLTPRCHFSCTPSLVVVYSSDGNIWTLVVNNTLISKWEDTRFTRNGSARWFCQILNWTSRCLSVGTISPVVGDHSSIGINFGCTPWSWRAGIGTLVILHIIVLEWKHTDCVVHCHTGIRNPSVGFSLISARKVKGVCLSCWCKH